jgi:putative ABC transport system permease protein
VLTTWRDLTFSIRSLLRAPTFALAGVLTLAIAVGMATSVFSIVNALLLRPLPYRDAGRLAMIWTSSSSKSDSRGPVSFDDFEDWARSSKTLESAALYSSYYKPIFSSAGHAQRLAALVVSHQYFTVMAAKPLLGRFFLPEEDRDGRDKVVVLSFDLWRAEFHSDPHIVGRSILINSRPQTIVGVAGQDLPPLPPSLAAGPAQIYRPAGERYGAGSRDGRHWEAIVRLRPNVSIEQAQADLNVRCRQMQREHPVADALLRARIVGLRDDMVRNVRAPLLALEGAVLLLLLIACANIANLLLAKSSARRREMAIRAALGAGKTQLARMLLSESLVLGLVGGFCGLLLAWWSTEALSAVAARVLQDVQSVPIDLRVLVFSLALSVASSILFGMAPVFWLNSWHLDEALRFGSRVAGDHRDRLRQFLAAGQIALALVLLVCAGLLGMSFLRLRSLNPGFDPRGVLTASVSLPQARYGSDAAVIQFVDSSLAKLSALPGVREAAMVSVLPLSGDFDTTGFQILGRTIRPGEQRGPDRYIVSPGYFQALHIPLRQGRIFDGRDDQNHPPVCVISETAARSWFPGQSPLGRKIRAGSASGNFDDSPFREVVGVAGDIAQYGLGLPPTPQIYMPHAQYAKGSFTFTVRSDLNADALAESVRKAVLAVDPEQPVYNVKPLEQIVSNTIAARRLGLWLLIVFACSALLLAAIGIYGVVSYSVAQRTSEFGIRIALGARPMDILRGAVADSLPMIAGGLAAGMGASMASSKLIAGFLFGVRTTDAAAFAILPVFLGLVAVAACYMPARRASKVDPVSALRFE